MKKQIRRGVFETNSSSVRSIQCVQEVTSIDGQMGNYYFGEDEKKFGTRKN